MMNNSSATPAMIESFWRLLARLLVNLCCLPAPLLLLPFRPARCAACVACLPACLPACRQWFEGRRLKNQMVKIVVC